MNFLVPDLRILHFLGKRRDLTVEEYLSNEQTGKELILNIQVPLDNKVIHMDQYIATNSILSRPLKVWIKNYFAVRFFFVT